jgi:PEGA domain
MTRRALSLVVLACLTICGARIARAEPNAAANVDAAKHFQRGVTMYNEADYRAALVEFRRAYETSPNAAVLYNIGQTYYQLQNYAAALVALGRYLTESGPSASHRREVEATVETLQSRVGKVAITTSLPGADVTVDDELVGKTPLDEPVLVSIGRRKITALRDGRVTETRFVDVAAGDTVNVALAAGMRNEQLTTTPKTSGKSSLTLGWVITGGLGAVMIGTGVGAYIESRSLQDARSKYHASTDDLNSKSNLVKWLSRTADASAVLTAIGAVVMLKYTFSRSDSSETRVALTPTGIQVAGKF